MKKTITLNMVFVLMIGIWSNRSVAQGIDFDWVRTTGGSLSDMGKGVALDELGYVYHTGCFEGTVTFGSGANTVTLTSAGERDVYVSKLDPQGNLIWAKVFTSTGFSVGNDIAVDHKGHVYITGEFTGNMTFGATTLNNINPSYLDAFVAKLDTSGNFIWAKQIGGMDTDRGHGVDVDTAGNIYVTGVYENTVNFDNFSRISSGGGEIFVAKLNPAGNFQWVTSMGGNQSDYGQHVSTDQGGNVFAIVHYQGDATFGSFNLTGAFWTVGVVRLNGPDGAVVWAKGFGGTYAQCWAEGRATPGSITTDGSGNVIATGLYQRLLDLNPSTNAADTFFIGGCDPPQMAYNSAFIVKLDGSGNFIWGKSLGDGDATGAGRIWPNGIATDQSGNIYTTGDLLGARDFDPGKDIVTLSAGDDMAAFISKLSPEGDFRWAKALGGKGAYARGNSIAVNTSGDVYTAGEFLGRVDFDPNKDSFNVASASDDAWDIYLHKLSCASDTATPLQVQADCRGYEINGEILGTTGLHYVTFTNTHGCDSVVPVDLFVVLPEPIINVDIDTLSTTQNYVSYQWFLDGQLIPGATERKYTVKENADYRVYVTDENGCSDTSAIYTVTNKTDIAGTAAKSRIRVYPNPAKDYIYVNSAVAVDIALTEIDGRTIRQLKNAVSLPIQDLAKGVYLLRITDKDGKLLRVEKLVKQ